MRVRVGGPVLTAIMVVALSPAASADGGVKVMINEAGSVYLSGPDVSAARDVRPGTKTTTRTAGGRESAMGVGGTSVSAVAGLAHIPTRFVRLMTFPGAVSLTGDEVRNGFSGDPAGHPRYATISAPGVGFFRPLRDDVDANARDVVATNGADLQVVVTTTNAEPRTVVIHANDKTPKPGQSPGFSVRVDHPSGGANFFYSWDFGDGTTGAGRGPSHGFTAGRYRIMVTAIGDDGSSGVATPVEIHVGNFASATPTPASGRRKPGRPQTGGPGRGGPGGGGPGAGGGAATGGGAGKDGRRASGPARSRGRGERTQRSSSRSKPRATATAAPSPTASRARRSSPAGDRAARKPRAPTSKGRPVAGVLLAGAGSVADVNRVLASLPAAAAQDRSPLRSGGGSGSSLANWLGGGGLIVALLAVGAAREAGVRRRRLRT